MTLLLLGIALWSVAHFFRRLAPAGHAGLVGRLGPGPARGVVAVVIAVGLVLIVIGFRLAPIEPLYDPPGWGIHLNNLMMLAAVALFGMGMSKGRARAWLRHPMLTAVIIWALAHLLVNGDVASVLLFGGMLLWAGAEIAVINANAPAWVRPVPGPASGDIRLVVITLVVFGVIVAIHSGLGYPPFPR